MAILMLVVWALPIAFTAIHPHSKWSHIAFFFTSTGGPIGFFILLLTTGFFYTLSEQAWTKKLIIFTKSVLSLVLIFGVLAWINEHVTKPILKLQRPSHVYVLQQTNKLNEIDNLYQLSKEERGKYFATLIHNNIQKFADIDKAVQEHWIEEAGFSFPSGHTFNAFLFAMVISYAIYFNRNRPHLKKWFFVPFIWACSVGISRVALGAHSALDVSAGACMGVLLGLLFLYIDFTRHWLTNKKNHN